MKRFLFAAATTLLAASGSAQATVVFQSISGPAVAGHTAAIDSATFAGAAEALLPQEAMARAEKVSSVGAMNSFSFNRASAATNGQDLGVVLTPASSASIPEPSSWLLAAAGFCALAAFSGRASGRDRRSRMYVPEDAMVIAAGERRAS